jgi:hypothetical protein
LRVIIGAVTVLAMSMGMASATWIQTGVGAGPAKTSIVEANEGGTTLVVDVPGINAESVAIDGIAYSRIVVPGAVSVPLDVGRPEVPGVPILLARPTGAKATVTVVSMETETLDISRVFPLQPPQRLGEEPSRMVVDTGFYLEDVEYPTSRISSPRAATWRDLDVVGLHVYPVVVRPAQHQVIVASRITIRVDFSGGSYPSTVTDWMQPMYRRLIQNYGALGFGPDLSYHPGTRLLVVCAPEYQNNSELNSLLGTIQSYGYSTELMVKQPAWGSATIKLKIRDRYFDQGRVLRWVLLVGEYDEVPPKADYSRPEWNGQVVPYCDYWYSDLREEDFECDDYPEIGIARLSPETGEGGNLDLSRQIQKIRDYWGGIAAGDWLATASLVAHKEDGASGFASTAVRGAATIPLSFYAGTRETLMGYIPTIDNDDVKSSVNQGTGVLEYLGHGGSGCWAYWNTREGGESYFNNADVLSLQNGYKTPVVFNIACRNGDLDKDVCLSEQWMRKFPGGAVASLASSGDAWIVPGCSQCTVAVRATRDYWALLPGEYEAPIFDLGGMKMLMDAYIASRWSGGMYSKSIYNFMWLGDPAMPVWSGGVPASAAVSYPTQIPLGSQLFQVDVTLGNDNLPVENARVCVSKANDFYESGLTNSYGHVEFVIDATTTGPFSVCASEGHVLLSSQGEPHTPMLPFWATGNVTGPSGWSEYASMPAMPSNRPIKDGGCMAFDAGSGLIYASKGNKTGDFYSYGMPPGTWTFREGIPTGAEGKQVYKGSVICSDGNGKLYLTKGNNSVGFWEYDAETDAWTQKTNVPDGWSGKRVKQGAGIAWGVDEGVGAAYLLKGYRNEFHKYDPETNKWTSLLNAPVGRNRKWDDGSWLVYDGDHKLYAHKAKYHEFYYYDLETDLWSAPLNAMPIPGSSGRNKKSKSGGCAAWYDGRIYALKGGNTTEFWCYSPETDAWQTRYDIPLWGTSGIRKKVARGAALAAYPGKGVYAFKGNKTLELWCYSPGEQDGGDPANLAASGGRSVAASGGPALGGEEPLMDGLEASKPRWNWQGTMVCYSGTDTLTEREQIYQCQYPASAVEQRVVDIDEDCEEPVYSPDGQYIAFQLDDTVSDFYQLCVTPAFDTGSAGLGRTCKVPEETASRTDAAETTTAVAPDRAVGGLGTRSELAGNSVMSPLAIGGVAASLGPVWQITFAEADHCYPEWSPDGEWLCYERDDDTGYTQVWRVPAFGGQEEQLTFGNSDHFLPSYLNSYEIVFVLSPDFDYDQIAKVNIYTHEVTVLSTFETDHDKPSPAWDGSDVAAEALDDSGNTQIVNMAGPNGETWLTSGDCDIMDPDFGQDNRTIFAVRWTGITSQIVWVDAVNGGYYPVTDSLAIRDNPDAHVDTLVSTYLAVYEREPWDPLGLLLGGGRRKRGRGVYVSRFRIPKSTDGQQAAGLGVFALDKAMPNPAAGKVTIRWQVPTEADVSLRVYNTAGQLVKVLVEGKTKPGAYSSVWNGKDTRGRRQANGVYFYALDNGAKRISRKVVLTE